MSFGKFVTLSVAAVCALGFVSCKDYVGKEASHPLYMKSMTAKANKSYAEAAAALEDFLVVCPQSPKAHRDLAEIYMDNLQDYESAVAHFRRYAALSKATMTAEEEKALRDYVQLCRRKEFESYRMQNGIKLASEIPISVEKANALKAENDGYRTLLQQFSENEKKLIAQKNELQKRLDEAVAAANKAASAKTAAASTAKPATAVSEKPAAASGKTETAASGGEAKNQRTYTVQKGDGLQLIAKKVYGSARHWKLIEEANKDALGANLNIKVGQVLVIPAIPE